MHKRVRRPQTILGRIGPYWTRQHRVPRATSCFSLLVAAPAAWTTGTGPLRPLVPGTELAGAGEHVHVPFVPSQTTTRTSPSDFFSRPCVYVPGAAVRVPTLRRVRAQLRWGVARSKRCALGAAVL